MIGWLVHNLLNLGDSIDYLKMVLLCCRRCRRGEELWSLPLCSLLDLFMYRNMLVCSLSIAILLQCPNSVIVLQLFAINYDRRWGELLSMLCSVIVHETSRFSGGILVSTTKD